MIIDPKSAVPIFRQIADQLRNGIETGVYRAGEMLPSQRTLAVEIKVNPNTVQRAYDALEREGIVETRRGVGVFVAKFDVAKRSETQQRLIEELTSAIRRAESDGMSAEAIRLAFEESMRRLIAGASSKC